MLNQGRDGEHVVHEDESSDKRDNEGNLKTPLSGTYASFKDTQTNLQIIAVPR